ncbi:phage protease [Brevundimonas sp.]|uniref:phage protease n=1 Tax=Brevundimonas sp. TaxID=1871086 RepID=UPI0025B8BF13|nr:phage protease [Brevundimonas sp.]MCG2663365.1 phage protease [Brevundimonas sp.]
MTTASATPNKQTGATIATPIQQIALNEAGTAPDWIELIPAGFDVQGRDGRAWINPDPEGVVAATTARSLPLPLDWEHATETRAPQGLDAPAAGWIEEVAIREGGSIWGRVDWTLRGRTMVEAKEYRFVSPVFAFDKVTGVIRRLISAALTNTPNLLLTALNRHSGDEGTDQLNREPPENPLSIATQLAAVLGLAATASDAEIVSAVTEAKAANRSADLSSFAPRADLDAAINRANAAETKLKEREAADHAKAIDAAIASAQDAGKIIPASVDDYRAMCSAEGGLERFNNLVKTMPVIAGAAESRASNKAESANTGSDLTDEERAVCRALGQDEATFKSTQQKAS